MINKDFSTLSYLARAVAVAPDETPTFVEAVRAGVPGAATLHLSVDLAHALDALDQAWLTHRASIADGTEMGLRDVVGIARILGHEDDLAAQRVCAALWTASKELVQQRRGENSLSADDRELATSELSISI